MNHEGERLEREIKQLKRQLEVPMDGKRRREVEEAIRHTEIKKHAWERPH